MDSRVKEIGQSSSSRFDPFPDVNAFQYMSKSPPGSVREYPVRPEDSVSMTAQQKETEFEVAEQLFDPNFPIQVAQPRRNRGSSTVIGSWTWELLSSIVALGALAGIFAVLREYNGRALKDWPHSITINTVLSILITVTKAAIIVPLAEGISQLKWSWYREREQTLNDIVVFDEASRGAFGAFKLITSMKPTFLASIGSLLLLASFAIGPFAQQVVQYSQREVLSKDFASLPICGGIYNDVEDGPLGGSAPGRFDIGLSTIGAIYDGILQNSTATPVQVSGCLSGNCTFTSYQTLGFCSHCADITSELLAYNQSTKQVVPAQNCSFGGCYYTLRSNNTLSNLVSSSTTHTVVNVTALNLELKHPDLKNIGGLLNVTAIYGEMAGRRSGSGRIAAYECTLFFCVQQYETKVVAGNVTEISKAIPFDVNSSASTSAKGWWGVGDNITITPKTCVRHNENELTSADECSYTIPNENGRGLNQAMSPFFTGDGLISSGQRPQWKSPAIQRLGQQTDNSIDNIATTFQNLANRLTRHARTVPHICQRHVKGSVWYIETYISVRWKFLALPIVVVGATITLLFVIIIRTRKDCIWKSSPLALVFLGMQDSRQSDGTTHPIFPTSPAMNRMTESSREIKLRLDRSGTWQVLGHK